MVEEEEPWEERTLHLLYNSKIDQDFSIAKVQKSGRKKHKVRWMSKRAMAIPQVIIELQDQALRESTLRCLSTFLLEHSSSPSPHSFLMQRKRLGAN
ncbi:hypothetical protein LOK49_LG04G01222 [Camellia lanceoleosa]|uniref:Uncharacterized protein n=1 Tax=Camellia lanceoleosa TaxID=1840588 RepID=A0ACC0I536_9ERIC|nr:hypothetical protein LOK49_LG04G01222 [Camellia lanceoleosa]